MLKDEPCVWYPDEKMSWVPDPKWATAPGPWPNTNQVLGTQFASPYPTDRATSGHRRSRDG